MSSVRTYAVAVTTTGGAGVASGNTDSDMISGWLEDIFLDYHASAPATTDVTISFKTRGGNVLLVSNNATDGLYAPRITVVDNANSVIMNAFDNYAIFDKLNVAVAQSDALTGAVTAYIRVREP